MNVCRGLASAVALIALGACATGPVSTDGAPLTRPEPGSEVSAVPTLNDRLPGDYLNYLQVWQQKVDENPSPDTVEGVRIVAVEQPGEFLLVERYVVGVPESSVRRWLRPTAPLGRFDAFTGPDTVSFDGVIDASDLTPDPGCDMTWSPDAEKRGEYTARAQGECELMTGWDSLALDTDGHLLVSVANGSKAFKRARWFKGWMGVKRQTWDPEASDDDWVFMGSFQIHNEGDIVRLVDKDGTPTGFSVQLERLVYQNTRTPVLKLGLIDEDKDKTIHYIWSEPGSRLLGMNLRWFQVGLTAL